MSAIKDGFAADLKEILELVKLCPAELQEKCFEMLLSSVLTSTHPQPVLTPNPAQAPDVGGLPALPGEIAKRLKVFATQAQVTEAELRKVFGFSEDGAVTLEVSDLKSKKVANQQRRLALLIGLKHHLGEASFDVPLDELREMCVTYGAYDATNFASNLRVMKEIFAGFKPGATNKLSPKGKSEAGLLVKELAQ